MKVERSTWLQVTWLNDGGQKIGYLTETAADTLHHGMGLYALRHGIQFQWKPFWLATQRDPQNDWPATPNRVNYDVFAQAPLVEWLDSYVGMCSPVKTLHSILMSSLFVHVSIIPGQVVEMHQKNTRHGAWWWLLQLWAEQAANASLENMAVFSDCILCGFSRWCTDSYLFQIVSAEYLFWS